MNIELPKQNARTKLLEAAFSVIREQGFSATSVDDLCAAAGVTKGAFFHHFATKEALGVAAADYWSLVTGGLFETAPYHRHADAAQRVIGYVAFRKAILQGEIAQFTCLAGTMVQETYVSSVAIRDACANSITGHAAKLEADIEEAMRNRNLTGFTARSLAMHTQVVLQGAFILAKALGSAAPALDSLDHLTRYLELLFNQESEEKA